ncbi:MAG: nuclear transport factor 2 family protein [Candidatus Binataceae bacterium]
MGSAQEHLAIADRLFRSIEQGDIEAVRRLYSPNARIWHNTDGVAQTVDQNLATLAWVVANIKDLRYTEVRREPTPDGFVQQHVLGGRLKSGGEFVLPACIVVKIENGMIVRLDEYLDSAKTAELRD